MESKFGGGDLGLTGIFESSLLGSWLGLFSTFFSLSFKE